MESSQVAETLPQTAEALPQTAEALPQPPAPLEGPEPVTDEKQPTPCETEIPKENHKGLNANAKSFMPQGATAAGEKAIASVSDYEPKEHEMTPVMQPKDAPVRKRPPIYASQPGMMPSLPPPPPQLLQVPVSTLFFRGSQSGPAPQQLPGLNLMQQQGMLLHPGMPPPQVSQMHPQMPPPQVSQMPLPQMHPQMPPTQVSQMYPQMPPPQMHPQMHPQMPPPQMHPQMPPPQMHPQMPPPQMHPQMPPPQMHPQMPPPQMHPQMPPPQVSQMPLPQMPPQLPPPPMPQMLPIQLSMPMSIPMMPVSFQMSMPNAPSGATPGPQSRGAFPSSIGTQTLSFPLAAPSPPVAGPQMQPTNFSQTLTSQAKVSVGNASLAALNSKEPPKFSCVLLAGPPAVGKTTLGHELVNSLKADGLGWTFFSGADFLPEGSTKHSLWEKTKDVFDALSKRLDTLLEQQKQHRTIKGLIIDKNLRGIEDLYYLTMLLNSKNIPFVGIIGMECTDDDILIQRMNGGDELREKLKFHHVIHARVSSLAKMASMYRVVDASKNKKEVVQNLRTMALGFCAQPLTKGIRTHYYEESHANVIVDSYEEYYRVMTALFECVSVRGFQFPTSTQLVPFSAKEMTDKARLNAIKTHYSVRRKPEGTHYLLLYVNEKMYLIPSHMRAVLLMTGKPWMGKSLENVAFFVLEGILTRSKRNRHKEIFLVYDVIFWSEKSQPTNNISMRMLWEERQVILKDYLLSEENVSFPDEVDCVIAYQPSHKLSQTLSLLDSEEYANEGLVLQPTQLLHRSDHVLLWRPPDSITVDFRIGCLIHVQSNLESSAGTSIKDNVALQNKSDTMSGNRHGLDDSRELPCRTYALEVYDKFEKKYVQYESATVDVYHTEVVRGSIITCRLQNGPQKSWAFSRIRYDLVRPDYLHEVKELLSSCLIFRAQFVSWLITEQIVVPEVQPANPVKEAPPPSYGIATSRLTSEDLATRVPPPPKHQPVSQELSFGMQYPKPSEMLARSAAQPVGPPTETPSQLQLLASIVPSLHIVRKGGPEEKPSVSQAAAKGTGPLKEEHAKAAVTLVPQVTYCAQCHRKKQRDDLRMDKSDRKYYCYSCWAKTGYGFCSSCGDFNEGDRETRGAQKGSFFCLACKKNNENKSSPGKGNAVAGSQPDEGVAAKSNQKQKRRNNRDTTAETTQEAVEQRKVQTPTELKKKSSRRRKKYSGEALDAQDKKESSGSTPKYDSASCAVSQDFCKATTMTAEVHTTATETPDLNHKLVEAIFPENADKIKEEICSPTNGSGISSPQGPGEVTSPMQSDSNSKASDLAAKKSGMCAQQ